MSELVRMSFSIEKPLMERLEKMVRKSHYTNRSEFIRDMIRDRLVTEEWEKNEEALGTVTLIYNHEERQLGKKLTSIQHKHHSAVMVSTHLHLDEHLCAETIVIRGKASAIREVVDLLRQQKGVYHAALSLSSTGKKLA